MEIIKKLEDKIKKNDDFIWNKINIENRIEEIQLKLTELKKLLNILQFNIEKVKK